MVGKWIAPLLMVLLASTFPPGVQAQSAPRPAGRIAGNVVDAQTGRPLSGAQVMVEGTGIGTLTDLDGRYLLVNVPPTTRQVVAQMLGYARKTVTGVDVRPDEVTSLDISLAPEAVALDGVTVSAERERGSASALLSNRRTADAMLDAIGSDEISRIPAGDAADVAGRMTGVTVTEGKYVYVRGLGERYSQTSLNGSPLPSPEPEKEVVPLDLFPAAFLESITAQKTYTPDLPGDFSGANIEITTLEFPSSFRGSIGIGTSFNTESQFRDDFLTYPGGDLDFLGIDDGTRALPELVEQRLGDDGRVPNIPSERERLGEAFPLAFTPVPTTTPYNRNLDFSLGNQVSLWGRDLGFIVAGTYSDSYTHRGDEIERKWRANLFDPDVPEDRRAPNVDYEFDTSTRNITWGTIANLTFLLSPTDKLSLKTTYNRNADDEARRFEGANREDLGSIIRSDRLRFVSRSLFWGQLSGEHETVLDSRFEWRLTGARATRDEPGLRQAVYLKGFTAPEDAPFYLQSFNESGRYFYSSLVDDDLSAQVDWEVPFPVWGGQRASVELGGMVRLRERDFDARRFVWEFLNGVVANDIENALDDGAIVGEDPGPGEFVLDDIFEPGDEYGVVDRREAGYLMLDLPIAGGLRAVAGARIERYDLELASRDSVFGEQEQTGVFPSLNLIYELNDRMNLRAAVSQTVERPEFRELAPFVFTEATSLRQLFGNPDLEVAEVRNADLGWEWFPSPGELVSVSVFYKGLTDPIEQVFIAAASSAYSYQNAEDGRLVGVEFDARADLDFISPRLSDISARANVALIDSEVSVVEQGIFIPTNPTRPLEGQAPYVVNTSLSYANGGGLGGGLFYQVVGERVTAAGGSGIPDIYQQPRHQLDITFRTPVPGGSTLKLKATNLLGAEYRWEQSKNGVTLLQRRYDPGRTYSVGLSWDF